MEEGQIASENKEMGSRSARDWILVALCLLCVAVSWIVTDPVAATEFSGGTVTGPILRGNYLGSVLFLIAAGLTFVRRRRLAAVAGLLAVLLSLPLYAFFIAPGVFYTLFRGEWSVPLQTFFVWDPWALAGVVVLMAAATAFLRRYFFGANL
jgi:hypothetical protein